MHHTWPQIALFVASLLHDAHAIRFPLFKRSPPNTLQRRDRDLGGDDNGSFGNGSQLVINEQNQKYFVVLSVETNEEPFLALLDTGSPDLVLTGSVNGSVGLGKPAVENLASGAANGTIDTANVIIDQFVIKNQAFIHLSSDEHFGPLLATSVFGVSPSTSSVVRHAVNNSDGDTPLDRISKENPNIPTFATILLSRGDYDPATDLADEPTGLFSIGEVSEGLGQITSQPKLPALADPDIQYWRTFLDSNGITGPDGKQVTTRTILENRSGQNSAQLEVVIDTGAPSSLVPKAVADALYSRIPGAALIPNTTVYSYPCSYEFNVSFWFAGVEFPIHPFDLGAADPADPTNQTCFALFQEISDLFLDRSKFGALDAILGAPFLRNAYTLFNYGNFINGSPENTSLPFMQFLPITDRAQAHQDFVLKRLNGTDTTGSQPPLLRSTGDATGLATSNIVRICPAPIPTPPRLSPGEIVGFVSLGILGLEILSLLVYLVVRGFRRENWREFQPYQGIDNTSGAEGYDMKYPPPTYGAGYQEPQYEDDKP